MAYIKVDHKKISSAANELEEYIEKLKGDMKSARREVDNLASTWAGQDHEHFKREWEDLEEGESAYKNALNKLEAYQSFLKLAAKEYRDAQIDAVNRSKLCWS